MTVLESALKYTLKKSNGQIGEWEDEVLVSFCFVFNLIYHKFQVLLFVKSRAQVRC